MCSLYGFCKWQFPVQPLTKMSSKWQHFRFREFLSCVNGKVAARTKDKADYALISRDCGPWAPSSTPHQRRHPKRTPQLSHCGITLKPQSHIACNRSATSLRPKFRVVAGRLQGGCKEVDDWSPTGCRRLQGRFGRKEVLVAASETSLRLKPRSHMHCNLSATALRLKNSCNQCNHCAIKNCVFRLQINRRLVGDNYP